MTSSVHQSSFTTNLPHCNTSFNLPPSFPDQSGNLSCSFLTNTYYLPSFPGSSGHPYVHVDCINLTLLSGPSGRPPPDIVPETHSQLSLG